MPREIGVAGHQLAEDPAVAPPGISPYVPRQLENNSLVGGQGKSPLGGEVDHHGHIVREGNGPLQGVSDPEACALRFVLALGRGSFEESLPEGFWGEFVEINELPSLDGLDKLGWNGGQTRHGEREISLV